MYCARFPGHGAALCRVPEVCVEPFGTGVAWGAVSVFLDEPLGVVSGGEGADGFSDVVDGLEGAAVDGLLLQASEQAFDDAVGFGLADEGVAWGYAPEPGLFLEVIGYEVAAMIVAERKAASGVGGEMAELVADGHAQRLGRFEASSELRDAPADQFGVPVLGDAEQPNLAVLDGGDLGGVDRPHDVGRVSDDLAIMRVAALSAGESKGILTHHAQQALAGDANTVSDAKTSPDLAVSLAGPWRRLQIALDGGEQGLVGDGRFRPAARRRLRRGALRLRRLGGVKAGAGHAGAIQTDAIRRCGAVIFAGCCHWRRRGFVGRGLSNRRSSRR